MLQFPSRPDSKLSFLDQFVRDPTWESSRWHKKRAAAMSLRDMDNKSTIQPGNFKNTDSDSPRSFLASEHRSTFWMIDSNNRLYCIVRIDKAIEKSNKEDNHPHTKVCPHFEALRNLY